MKMKRQKQKTGCMLDEYVSFFFLSTFLQCAFSLNQILFKRRLWRLDREVGGIGESLRERWRSVSVREGGGKAGGRERQRVSG